MTHVRGALLHGLDQGSVPLLLTYIMTTIEQEQTPCAPTVFPGSKLAVFAALKNAVNAAGPGAVLVWARTG